MNLDFPLDIEDRRFLLSTGAVEEWFPKIELKMKSWEITEDRDKLAVCRRNLTGTIDTIAGTKTWGSFEDFKRWLYRTAERKDMVYELEKQLETTVQARSFREYERRFLAARRMNSKSLYPSSEQTIISYFLRNMRSMDLKHMLLRQIFTNYEALVEFAEDLIRKGRVKERYPSNYPPLSRLLNDTAVSTSSSIDGGRSTGSTGTIGSTSLGTAKDHHESPEEPDLFAPVLAASKEATSKRERMFPPVVATKEPEPEPVPIPVATPVAAPTPTPVNGEGWRTRMSFALVDHPLDLDNPAFTLEVEAVRAWMAVIEKSLATLDFRNHQEEVSFCLFNARGIVAQAARHHGTFTSFAEFRTWVWALYGLKNPRRDVIRALLTTTQSDSLQRYIFRFRKLVAENEHCTYPVSPELLGEFFVDNLRDETLQARLEREKLHDLAKLMRICEKLLDLGEVPENYVAWEARPRPFSTVGSGSNPASTSTSASAVVLADSDAAHAKRLREDLFYQRPPRDVRVKTDVTGYAGQLRAGSLEVARRPTKSRDMVGDSWHLGSENRDSYSLWKYRD